MKRRKKGNTAHLLLIALLVLLVTLICLYVYYKQKDPKKILKSAFIYQKPILLDQRITKKHGSWTRLQQVYEPKTVELIYEELKRRVASQDEALLIDIGANTGSFALLPVLSDKIQVIAFEPNLEIADILRTNVKLNAIERNVRIVPIGISDHLDYLQLHIPGNTSTGLATFGQNVQRFDPKTEHTNGALVMPLDAVINSLIKNKLKIDVIKIDTESWEYYVLLGARETIAKHKPYLLLEFVPINMQQAGVNPDDVLELLKTMNYTCEKTSEDLYCKNAE